MTIHPNLVLTRLGSTGLITIDRAAQRNAITLDMWRTLRSMIEELGEAPDVRSIVLTGAGGTFSAGADIREFATVRQSAAASEAYEEAVDGCCDALFAVRKPTFAAINGFCLGGACHIALSADFRIADASAKFAIPAARMSIVYGVRATQKLLALVGLAQAKRILYLAQQIGADTAERIGLVDQIVDDPLKTACEMAETVNANAPLTVSGAKFILNGLAMGKGALDAEGADALIRQAADSADFIEGRTAFDEKRAPKFTGK